MAERATISQVVQLGPETVQGTAVAATRKLSMTSIMPNARIEQQSFRPMGQLVQSVKALGKQWTEASIEGMASYVEMPYLLCSVLKTVTPAAAGAPDVGAYTWTITPAINGGDTYHTFTVERGSAVRAEKFTFGTVTDFELTANRSGVSIGGKMVGRALQRGITLTPGLTSTPVRPIVGDEWSIYLDSTSGGLGTTRLSRVHEVKYSIGSRYQPYWTLDASQSSFVTLVEVEPTFRLEVLLQADSTADTLMSTYLEGEATAFFRFDATGPLIVTGGGISYRFRVDMAAMVAEVGDYEDADGVYARRYTFDMVNSASWGSGQYQTITMQNNLASL